MNGEVALSQALARCGAVVYGVPGFPVTGLMAACRAELVGSEKTCVEYALGTSLAGRRAAVLMKHPGLNVASDVIAHATTQGLAAGVVVVVGDDTMAAFSETAQDSRYFGEALELPVLEPGPDSCMQSVEEAFLASEQFSRVALIRVTPELLLAPSEESRISGRKGRGSLAARGLTMKGRTEAARTAWAASGAWSASSDLNRLAGGDAGCGAAPGETRVVTVWPPPPLPDGISVNETGRPFLGEHAGHVVPPAPASVETTRSRGYSRSFCPGCPFLTLFSLMKERGLTAICDAGCSVLLMNPPWESGIASYGLGSAIGVAARSTRTALIGDFGMLHSGIVSLIDVFEKDLPLLTVVMDNRCLAMTGGQPAAPVGRYLEFAHPVVCDASDEKKLREYLVLPDRPTTLVVTGTCPEGRHHETLEC